MEFVTDPFVSTHVFVNKNTYVIVMLEDQHIRQEYTKTLGHNMTISIKKFHLRSAAGDGSVTLCASLV